MARPDFIGLGAQKAGTSWIYACLNEHPLVCMPRKELHYFSRDRNWSRGRAWYEELFEACPAGSVKGEFSTSYLYDLESADRIHASYPDTKLLASLRNPVDRAISNYVNDIKAGVVPAEMPFERALEGHPEYLEQGRYAGQLERYFRRFDRRQLLVMVYEDSRRDPLSFIRTIYRFLQVDDTFTPSYVRSEVNVGRIPRVVAIERALNAIAGTLRKSGFGWLVWQVKRSGIPEWIRTRNYRQASGDGTPVKVRQCAQCYDALRPDILAVEELLGRRLPWHPA
jgi:hypothetical protein